MDQTDTIITNADADFDESIVAVSQDSRKYTYQCFEI